MAAARETDPSKPMDEVIFGMVSELLGRNASEHRGSLRQIENPEAEPLV